MAAMRVKASPLLAVPRRRGVVGSWHPGPALLVLALFGAPFVLNEYWTFNVMTGLVLAIACLGLLVLVGWAGQISLMHAGVVGASAYISGYVARQVNLAPEYGERELQWLDSSHPALLGLAVGVLVGVALYLTVGLVVRRLAGPYVVVLTFAMQFAIEHRVFVEGRLAGNLGGYPPTPRPEPFGISLEDDRRFYLVIAAALIALVSALHRLRTSRFGRAIVFSGHDPEAAAAAGIAVWRYRVLAWVVAGLCAGVAGALSAPMYRNPPGIGQYISFNSLYYLAVAVAAGSASLLGLVAVAVALQLAPQILLDWKLNVYLLGGAAMAMGILLGPRGVGGLVIDLLRFDRPHRPPPPVGEAGVADDDNNRK